MSGQLPPHPKSLGLGLVLKLLTKSLNRPTLPRVSVSLINPAIVGGEDLQKLLKQLQPNAPVTMRALAAVKIAELLDQYLIALVPEIWYRARDLINPGQPRLVRRPAIRLLRGCIAQGLSLVANRLVYFRDILTACQPNDPDYDLFLKALSVLTNDGQELLDLVSYMPLELSVFLTRRLVSLDANWQLTVEFIDKCLHHRQFDDLTATAAVNKMIELACTLEAARAPVFAGVVDYLQYYQVALVPLVRFVCALYAIDSETYAARPAIHSLASLEGTRKDIIAALCNVITAPEIAQCRLMALAESRIPSKLNANVLTLYGALGAIDLVTCTLVAGESDPVAVALALKTVVDTHNLTLINTQVLRCLDRLFAVDSWPQHYDNYRNLFSEVLPFNTWLASPSIFDVMILVNTTTDNDNLYVQLMLLSVRRLWGDHQLECDEDAVVKLFTHFSRQLNDECLIFVIKYYSLAKLCCALNPSWRDNCARSLNLFYFHSTLPLIRLECLKMVHEAHQALLAVFGPERVDYELLCSLFPRLKHEKDPVVLDYLIDSMFTYIAFSCPDSVYFTMCDTFLRDIQLFRQLLVGEALAKAVALFRLIGLVLRALLYRLSSERFSPEFLRRMAMVYVRIFCVAHVKYPAKAARTYQVLITFLEFLLSAGYTDVALLVLKLLVRLRVTTERYIYITLPADIVGLALTFGRNRDDESYVTKSLHKWTFPDTISYIPNENLDTPSARLQVKPATDGVCSLDIEPWIRVVLQIVEKFYSFELYLFVWSHFCSQLANLELFAAHFELVAQLKLVICTQLTLGLSSAVKTPTDEITPAEIQVALIRTMLALLAYHTHFSKRDEDELIKALILGLDWWERTAVPCINLLTACCYEIPLSVQRFVPVILTKLQMRVTLAGASTHTLELLMALCENLVLQVNLTADDYKRVFGIAFKYVQYAQDMTSKNLTQAKSQGTDIPWQYVLTMLYRVICEWFLKMLLSDRANFVEYLMKNIVLVNSQPEDIDDNTAGLLDFVGQFSNSNMPLSIYHPQVAADAKRWMVGLSVIAISTDASLGKSQWLVVRPLGVLALDVTLHGDLEDLDVLLAFYMLQLFLSVDKYSAKALKPTPVPDTPMAQRALALLDRIPTVEFHKIGIVYVAPGQSSESDVLSNNCGLRRYHEFLKQMGLLYRLKQLPPQIYVGGLDTENDMDGEYTRYWRDRTLQVVWHIPTMMNSTSQGRLPSSIQVQQRKKHIGNDYVNIYYDELGLSFDFDLIKSQFNFMAIVITPHTWRTDHSSAVDAPQDEEFFRVKVYRRAGVPLLFAALHFKMISSLHLPTFVRMLAIMADHFAHVWHNPNHPFQIWLQRARALKDLRDKVVSTSKKPDEAIDFSMYVGST